MNWPIIKLLRHVPNYLVLSSGFVRHQPDTFRIETKDEAEQMFPFPYPELD